MGRSLADFGELWPAEQRLLDCCRRGCAATITAKLPKRSSPRNRVRAAFVRFLALGGGDEVLVHEHGVQLRGACLIGLLELNVSTVMSLALVDCRIERIEAVQAKLTMLNLNGCRLIGGLWADGLRCEGSISFGEGFEATGEIRLSGASLGGSLICSGRFENRGDTALSLDGIMVGGSINLRNGFYAIGLVRLNGAKIDIHLDCIGSRFENCEDIALECDSAQISGSVYFRAPFVAIGDVRLVGATIGGNLECDGARFDGVDAALSCNGATIGGSLLLRDGFSAAGTVDLGSATIGRVLDCEDGAFWAGGKRALSCAGSRVADAFMFRPRGGLAGAVDLTSMQVAGLWDDKGSWDGARKKGLILDGFIYGRLAGAAPTDSATRIAWLDLQWPPHLNREFRPQPWEQLIAVLRAMGHPEQARAVAIGKQMRLRRAKKIPFGARTLHRLYGLFVGYGYRPMRLLATTASVWLVCALAYWAATNPGWFGAQNHLLAPPPAEAGRTAPPPDYRNFVPLIYSADVLLPVVDLGYKDEWQPVVADRAGNPLIWGQLLRFLYWFEIAFGWVAGLLLVGVLGNLIKKD